MSILLRLVWSALLTLVGAALGWWLRGETERWRVLGTRAAPRPQPSGEDEAADIRPEPRRSLADTGETVRAPLDLQAYRAAKQVRRRPAATA